MMDEVDSVWILNESEPVRKWIGVQMCTFQVAVAGNGCQLLVDQAVRDLFWCIPYIAFRHLSRKAKRVRILFLKHAKGEVRQRRVNPYL